jgi:hypothetical protein
LLVSIDCNKSIFILKPYVDQCSITRWPDPHAVVYQQEWLRF